MIQLKPTLAGFPSEEATQILIRPIINSTTDTSCTTYWELCNSDGKPIANGNTDITDEEYLLWDDTNESLENIVLAKLKLQRK
jgi:hypothetical protein